MTSKRLQIAPALLAAVFTAACQSGPNTVSVEANELGIVQVEIEHASEHGDPLLLIRGFDASEQEVARFSLRTGSVLYSSDPGSIPEVQTLGRELDITVGREAQHFAKGSTDAWVVPPRFFSAPGTQFMRLAPVAAAIEEEAEIRFLPDRAPADEVAFAYMSCAGSSFPVNTNPQRCCRWASNYDVLQITTSNGMRYRNYSTPCTTSGGSTNCGTGTTTTCDYGPAGGMSGPENASTYPYQTSDTNECAVYAGPGMPGNFGSYPGSVTGSNGWQLCLQGGFVANVLNVMTSGGVGLTSSSPSGISISGSGSGSAVFHTVTITAQDIFESTSIVMSGACNASGTGTVQCSPNMSSGTGYLNVVYTR